MRGLRTASNTTVLSNTQQHPSPIWRRWVRFGLPDSRNAHSVLWDWLGTAGILLRSDAKGMKLMAYILQIGQRTAVRNRYRIEGNGCGDCMCAWCCTPCSLTQEVNEVDQEERALARAAAPQMYVQDGKM